MKSLQEKEGGGAAKLANLETIPCLIKHCNDEKAIQIALIENVNRENLNVIEEAQGVSRLLEEFDYTHEEAGAILGKPRSDITNLLRLLKLDQRVQNFIREEILTQGHGKILAGLPIDKQYYFAQSCVDKNLAIRDFQVFVNKDNVKKNNKKTGQSKNIEIQYLENELSTQFGYPIEISYEKNKKGAVHISFSNLDQLEGIMKKMGYKKNDF